MIYVTGDPHGHFEQLREFDNSNHLTRDDVIVVLGDACVNARGVWHDRKPRHVISKMGATLLCIHGNHEKRPATLPQYHEMQWRGGTVYVEDEWPNCLFAKDGEVYDLDGLQAIVAGGAYSVDKMYRVSHGMPWFPDEQPSPEIKAAVEARLDVLDWHVDLVLSHTCPYKYRPTEMFLPGVNQEGVDSSTEEWLDALEDRLDYKRWYCGHWHTDKTIDKLRFLYHTVEPLQI